MSSARAAALTLPGCRGRLECDPPLGHPWGRGNRGPAAPKAHGFSGRAAGGWTLDGRWKKPGTKGRTACESTYTKRPEQEVHEQMTKGKKSRAEPREGPWVQRPGASPWGQPATAMSAAEARGAVRTSRRSGPGAAPERTRDRLTVRRPDPKLPLPTAVGNGRAESLERRWPEGPLMALAAPATAPGSGGSISSGPSVPAGCEDQLQLDK